LDEDGGHYFFQKCKFVKRCWRAAGLETLRCKLSDLSSARQVSEYILALKEEEKMLAIGLIWAWWDARNKVNAGEQLKPVDDVVYRTRTMSRLEVEVGTDRPPVLEVVRQRWNPPPEGIWKINVDGAFWEQEKKGAWGFVVRDDQGHAALAGAGSLETVYDALIAESHACIAAL
jgi:hypothetical protein